MTTPVPYPVVLALQWTLLLTLGWGIHALVRDRHPRWRLALWRSILVFGVALPFVSFVRLPRWTVPAPRGVAVPAMPSPVAGEPVPRESAARTADATKALRALAVADASRPATAVRAAVVAPAAGALDGGGARVAWWRVLALVWLAGCGWEAIRLLRLQLTLRGIVRRARAADASVQTLAREIRGEFRIARDVDVRVSDAIASPFLCGVVEPAILIPGRLAANLAPAEIDALLSHELAHQCRHDLAWCIAWRWMKALCWFHPLVWRIPEAHVLACEEEADRVAAGRVATGGGYARILAQLALRVLHVPAAESRVSLNATCHLARRLVRLGRERAAVWRLRHSITALAGAMGLLVVTAGWQFAQEATPAAQIAPAAVEMAEVVVTVQDEQGRAIMGATITPDGLRPGTRSGHYGWRAEKYGPATKVVTDAEGRATVRYPVAIIPAEKLLTAEISFSVDHPSYASARPTDFPLDERRKPVVLKRGIAIRVAGYFGPGREPVMEIVPHLMGDSTLISRADWLPDARGGLTWRRMSPGKHFLHVAGRRASGEMVYSDGVAFFAEQRDGQDFTVEMKPGVRVEGRLDAQVARPIRNGWVQLAVHDDEADLLEERIRRMVGRNSGNTGFWSTHRPIAADGTFVFESVPRGELKVIAYGEGFISSTGPAEMMPGPTGQMTPRPVTRGVPQSFPANLPVTTIEVATEATVPLAVVVKAEGRPLAGAKVHVWPNMIQMPAGSRIFGAAGPSSETPFRQVDAPTAPNFVVPADANGVAVIRDVPAFTTALAIEHEQFELPLKVRSDPRFSDPPRREVELKLTPGKPERIEVTLQPKGREFIGSNP